MGLLLEQSSFIQSNKFLVISLFSTNINMNYAKCKQSNCTILYAYLYLIFTQNILWHVLNFYNREN